MKYGLMLVFQTIMMLGCSIVQANLNNHSFNIQNANMDDRDYVVLQKNKSFAEQLTKPNTTYEVRYNYNLNKGSVILPIGCILKFSGGIIDNGVIKGNASSIEAGNIQIFGHDLMLNGSWNTNTVNVCWFGAKNDVTYNSTEAFKAANRNAWAISDTKREYEYYGETKTVAVFIPTGVYSVSGNDIFGSIREENRFPYCNTNSLYKVEGNNSIIYWVVNQKDDVLFRFDYTIGHQSVSDLKVFVANNTKEEYAGTVFMVGNNTPQVKSSGQVYEDASFAHYKNIHVTASRKGSGGVYKIFDVTGVGMCDGALVQHCGFGGFLYCFYNTNSEAVSWNFETCSFFSTAKEARYFYLTNLSQFLMVNNSAFSYCDGQTLCEFDCEVNEKKKLVGNDRDNIIFNNTRFEGLTQNNKEWFVVFKGTAGKLILQNCNFDAASSYKINHQFLLSDLGSVYITNCAMAKVLFTIPIITTKSLGLGDQNTWAIVTDNLRCDNLVLKGYDWEQNRLIDMTEAYLSKGMYYRYADFKNFRGKSSNGYKLQSFYITPNTKSEVQFEEKTFSFLYGNSSLGNNIILPPFCVVRKISLVEKGSIPANVRKLRIYAGEKNKGVYTDIPANLKTSGILFEGSIIVFDEDINKQFIYCSYISDQGKEVDVNSGCLLITYTPLTDPSIYSIKSPTALIIKN